MTETFLNRVINGLTFSDGIARIFDFVSLWVRYLYMDVASETLRKYVQYLRLSRDTEAAQASTLIIISLKR